MDGFKSESALCDQRLDSKEDLSLTAWAIIDPWCHSTCLIKIKLGENFRDFPAPARGEIVKKLVDMISF